MSECSPKLECVRVARIDGRSLNMIVGGPVFTLADDPILYADVDGVTIHGCPANLVRAGQFYAVEWFNRTGDTDPDGYPIYWRVLAPKCRLEQRLGGEWRLTPKPISSAHLARILGDKSMVPTPKPISSAHLARILGDKSMVPGRVARVGLEARAPF